MEIRSIRWTPSMEQRRIAGNIDLPIKERQTQILLENRKKIWVNGRIDDIKQGEYPVNYLDRFRYGVDPELIDWMNIEQHKKVYVKTGWVRGLENNISMKIGNVPVLVMDNHNFAASYIVEMFMQGIIKKESVMSHIDDHFDINRDNGMNIRIYEQKKSEAEKLECLLTYTDVVSWQYWTLIRSEMVSEYSWRWYFIETVGHPLKGRDIDLGYLRHPLKPHDIVDVDIDVLYPIDSKLSEIEKKEVLDGKIPVMIKDIVDEIVGMTKSAKVMTIATSPGYINQPRALVYLKELLRGLEKSLGQHDWGGS